MNQSCYFLIVAVVVVVVVVVACFIMSIRILIVIILISIVDMCEVVARNYTHTKKTTPTKSKQIKNK